MMRVLLAAMAASALISGTAFAAETTASPAANTTTSPATTMTTAPAATTAASPAAGTATGSSNNAVNGTGNQNSTVNASGTINTVAPSALEKGANSFTESQAMSRIESAGFTQVTGLQKDSDGIWRGKAMRDGKSVDVGFDYKGNIGVQ